MFLSRKSEHSAGRSGNKDEMLKFIIPMSDMLASVSSDGKGEESGVVVVSGEGVIRGLRLELHNSATAVLAAPADWGHFWARSCRKGEKVMC